MFSGLGLKPLPLVFSLILPVASRHLHPYSTDNKTSRLMMKRFSTVRDNQRGSQNYMKNMRGEEGDRGEQEEGRRETDLSSYLFPKCSP